MKEWLREFFKGETEFTKKWMARFTRVVFVLLLFYIVFSQELLLFHFKLGLSREMCKIFFECYTGVMKVLITGYAVTFISSMGKAFLAKQQEEKNRLERDLTEMAYENMTDEESVDIDEDYLDDNEDK